MTAEEFLLQNGFKEPFKNSQYSKLLIEFAKLKCEEQLTAILENVKTKDDYSFCGNTGSEYPPDTIVDKDSILNAYPLNLIK
jgi:hypothetical protein